jgi:hypothetical protein
LLDTASMLPKGAPCKSLHSLRLKFLHRGNSAITPYQTWVEHRQTYLAHLIPTTRSLAQRGPPALAACGAWALAEFQRLGYMAKAPTTGWRKTGVVCTAV